MNHVPTKAKTISHKVIQAERVGFEPTVPLRIHYLSRVANSTTLASLRYFKYTESRIFFQWPGKYFKFPNLHGM
jgi:hypothetical protein